MDNVITSFLGWVAPIASTVIVTALTAQIKARQDAAERKRDEAQAETDAKRKAEAEWRERIEGKMDEQECRVMSIIEAQCSQMRSDILHKVHRYMDDLGCASIEEKDALKAEHKEYAKICAMYGIENELIDELVEQVMHLPNRKSIDMQATE